ncbi:hypothetical protein CUMW_061620 [Citrus unshiu]|uniref:Mei2-like C-terminal RNA recognition motif domain-containing protein n=1 Tax=Citrus unshiu TaxID=55188 RepID=A0A2H5NNP8_CITUN|nr:hypothetical protein CUMW_061620 [Citrus unshiu]
MKTKAQPWTHAPQPPSSKSELLTNTSTTTEADRQLLMRPVNSLNPHAKPFVPQPTKALFLPHHAPPALTHHFSSFQLHYPMNMNMMCLYHQPTTPIRSSYPYSYSYPKGNSNGEACDCHVQLLWSFSAPKEAATNDDTGKTKSVGDGDDGYYQVLLAGGETTLMIKNIPNRFKRHDLLQILDNHCWAENMKAKLHSDPCRSEYDFLYLPMDFCACGDQGMDALKIHFQEKCFNCHTDSYLPVILAPPRDGWMRTRPTIVGRCINVGAAAPVYRRKSPLMMRRKCFKK